MKAGKEGDEILRNRMETEGKILRRKGGEERYKH